ncbi:MAG: hypothetical protein ACE5G2_08685 [Candidatus Krumholzibacteriia bacterium]
MKTILDRRRFRPARSRIRGAGAALGVLLLGSAGCVSTFSTDVPVEFHRFLQEKYLGRPAWTRLTLQDEKKNIRIEQDQEIKVVRLGLMRAGSVTVETPNGRQRVVFAFDLQRPVSLEHYEKALLDALWFDSPEERYARNKQKYGTRLADAIRDHRILKDMTQKAAYLAWGAPSKVVAIKRGSDESWEYNNLNLKNARIEFRGGRVVKVDGENVSDTEAAKKRKRFRRRSS